MLLGVFDPRLPPYPEFMTRESGCPDKYKPVRKEGRLGPYYILYAGKRLTYGGCSEDLIEYRASIGFFYLPKEKRVVRLEYFIPTARAIDALIGLNDSSNAEATRLCMLENGRLILGKGPLGFEHEENRCPEDALAQRSSFLERLQQTPRRGTRKKSLCSRRSRPYGIRKYCDQSGSSASQGGGFYKPSGGPSAAPVANSRVRLKRRGQGRPHGFIRGGRVNMIKDRGLYRTALSAARGYM